MDTKISDVAIKPIKVKSEEKNLPIPFSNSSCEVYYRDESVAIPFRWESQPGTPKVKFPERERPLPPLTPPPSYQSIPAKKPSKSSIFSTVLLRLNPRKNQLQSSPTSSFSSSSSSPSSSGSVRSLPFTSKSRGKQRYSSPRLSFESRADEDDYESPVSTFCFGTARNSNFRYSGCSANVIKLLLR